jgi:pimeloyl-ACP methyl ester carboxylesterase
MTDVFCAAEARLFDSYRIPFETRSLRLADPDVAIAIRETGSGDPVGFVHGSGMSGATWAPLLAHLPDCHAIALDLPGSGAATPIRPLGSNGTGTYAKTPLLG